MFVTVFIMAVLGIIFLATIITSPRRVFFTTRTINTMNMKAISGTINSHGFWQFFGNKRFSATSTNSRPIMRMDRRMDSPVYQQEIVYIIVLLVAVFVMHNFIWLQGAFQKARHYKPTFKNVSKFDSIRMIGFSDKNVSSDFNTSTTPRPSFVASSMISMTSSFASLALCFHVFSLDRFLLSVKGAMI